MTIRRAKGKSATATYSGSLEVDIWKPTTTSRPAIIILHGGAWQTGSREDLAYQRLSALFSYQGFAVFNADYTLSGAEGFTPQTPIDEVLTLVQWVRDNATTYNADAARVGILGISAGGHLALMAGITGSDGTTRPDAVVGWSPGTDLVDLLAYPILIDVMVAYMTVGYTGNEAAWEAKSPQRIVTSDCCPLRIVGSDNENTETRHHLPVEQFDDMHTAALAVSVDSTKVIKAGSLHGLFDGYPYAQFGLGESADPDDVANTASWFNAKM